jgi:plastocyanin
MMSRKSMWLGLVVISLVAVLGLAACGPKTATLIVDTQEFKFVPDHWSVPAGAKVTLTLKDTGALDHTWVIMKKGTTASAPFGTEDEANILYRVDVTAGKSQTFMFDAPTEPGDYEVVCSNPAHLEQGMKGTLTVTQ